MEQEEIRPEHTIHLTKEEGLRCMISRIHGCPDTRHMDESTFGFELEKEILEERKVQSSY